MKPCTQCGRCCLNQNYMNTLQASGDDVKRWRRQGRIDILLHAEVIGPAHNPFADLWFKMDGSEVKRCPFVRKVRDQDRYLCTIYETRPEVCRGYPYSAEQRDECEMIEPNDTDADVERFMGRCR